MKSFTFSILVYNHEKWIREHLESIKYLIERYKPPVVDILISDDASSDKSKAIIDDWLLLHSYLFRSIHKIYNTKNIGTVSCCKKIIKECKTDILKITAGDDVYSFKNIFMLSNDNNESSIVSGIPLYIRDGELTNDTKSDLLHVSSSIIYRDKSRFDMLHATNAPNILYNLNQLRQVIDHPLFEKIKIVEDLLIQVLLSYKKFTFTQIYTPFVYYRRTEGSSYLIKGSQFDKDQKEILNFQISKSQFFTKFLLKNKYFCFGVKNKFFKYLLNVPFYIFVFKFLLNLKEILKYTIFFRKKNNLNNHKSHYSLIKKTCSE